MSRSRSGGAVSLGRVCLAGALGLTLLGGSASASEPAPAFLRDVVRRARAALEQASSERAPKPPIAVAHEWRTSNRGSIETGSPLLALEAANLDASGGDELIALTTSELMVIRAGDQPSIVARIALPSAPAVIRSRDPVGTISVEREAGAIIVAVRTSEQAHGARYRLGDGGLVLVGELPAALGFPLCQGISADLELGKNGFDPASLKAAAGTWPLGMARPEKSFYRLECRDVIGTDGVTNRVVAVTGVEREIALGCQRDRGKADPRPCGDDAVSSAEVTGAGVAFEVADLNRDGRAEIVSSLGKAPGSADRIRVFGRDGKQLKSKNIDVGVVAITALDLAGDGRRHLYFAVRQPGDKRINLWTLNRHP